MAAEVLTFAALLLGKTLGLVELVRELKLQTRGGLDLGLEVFDLKRNREFENSYELCQYFFHINKRLF